MALLALIAATALADVPEALREHYKEIEDGPFKGQFMLDVTQTQAKGEGGVDAVFSLEDVKGLKTSLQKERTRSKELESTVKKFEGITDPEAALAAIQKLEELGDDVPDEEKIRQREEALKSQLTKKHGETEKQYKDRIDKLEGQLSKMLVDNRVQEALAALDLVEGGPKILAPHMKNRIKIVKDESGELEAKVIDLSTGMPAISMKASNDGDMDISELAESFATDKDFKFLFKGSGASGSGPTNGKKGGKPEGRTRPNGSEGSREGDQSNRGVGLQRRVNDPAAGLMEVRSREGGGR